MLTQSLKVPILFARARLVFVLSHSLYILGFLFQVGIFFLLKLKQRIKWLVLFILEWLRNSFAQDGGKAATMFIITRKVLHKLSSGNSYKQNY